MRFHRHEMAAVRRAAFFCLIVFLAPVAMRLAAASADGAAMCCGTACRHATGTASAVACCPMGGTPEVRCCSHAAAFLAAPPGPPPMLLTEGPVLSSPRGSSRVDAFGDPDLLSPFLPCPDKVPLRSY